MMKQVIVESFQAPASESAATMNYIFDNLASIVHRIMGTDKYSVSGGSRHVADQVECAGHANPASEAPCLPLYIKTLIVAALCARS